MRRAFLGKDRSGSLPWYSGLGPMVRGAVLGLVVAIGVVAYVHIGHNIPVVSGDPFRSSLPEHEAFVLGDKTLAARPEPVFEHNPWAGASRRRRSDLVVTVPGCGGTYRPLSKTGSNLLLRYILKRGTTVLDSTHGRSPVSVVLGSSQVSRRLDEALHGTCAGETVRVSLTNGIEIIVSIINLHPSPDQSVSEDDDDNDQLATSLVPLPGTRGRSCIAVCSMRGLSCEAEGFKVVNSCPRLRAAFPCTRCEVAAVGTSGADMPCFVSLGAPEGHPRGFCMVHPHSRSATCDATYKYTRRLCPCLKT
jgi:hypothetical protein